MNASQVIGAIVADAGKRAVVNELRLAVGDAANIAELLRDAIKSIGGR